ncbi:MAG: DNA repair exonuclease [Candidatus Aenigmatarchaeota archaeon]
MLIGIFSDCHCGYKFGEERGEDSFITLNETIDKTLDCDLILIAGDLFDTRIPRPEVFAKVARILSKARHASSNAKFLEIVNKEKHEISPLALRGIPIIAIHGTHERRSRFLVNPIQALEYAGLLIYLHCSTIVFEIEGKKVAIHGMSGVPDKYAKDCFEQWNPKPIENAINILMLHNSIAPYIYSPLEPPSMKLEDLPKGFDLYILGHMHWHEVKALNNSKLLVCGSTVPTAIRKIESEQQKCIFKYNGEIKAFPLDFQRKIFWEEYEFGPNVKDSIENFLETLSLIKPKPIVNIKIRGLKKDSLINFLKIEEKFSNKAIININKEIGTESLQEQLELIKALKSEKLSPEEHGLRILQEKLKEFNCGIKVDEIFDYLVEGDVNLIFNILVGNQEKISEQSDNKS